MDRALPLQHSYCTFCGAPLVDRACSASCPESQSSVNRLAFSHTPTDVPTGSDQTTGHQGSGAMTPARPSVDPPSPGPATLEQSTRVGNVARWAYTGVALAVLAVAVVAGLGFMNLSRRLGDLQSEINTLSTGQESARNQLKELSNAQNQLSDRLSATRNELARHPAATKIAKQAQPSVLTIFAGDYLGSGFVVSSAGGTSQLLTNYHVVEPVYASGGRSVTVRRGDTSYDGDIIDVSQADDLAVITVHEQLPALHLESKHAAIGSPVLVLGSPNGLAGTVTSGIVSSYRDLDNANFLQFSAPISPGNSGGPVLDETGGVLGVTVMKDIRDQTEGIGYAIPTDRVCVSLSVC